MKTRYALAVIINLLALSTLLSGCSFFDSPERGAKEWIQAIASLDGLKLDDRTCSWQKQGIQSKGALGTAFRSLAENIVDQKVKFDVSDLVVTRTWSVDSKAEVRVTGKLRGAIGLMVQSLNLDETWYMAKESGIWRYCGPVGNFISARNLERVVTQKEEVSAELGYMPASYDPLTRGSSLFGLGWMGQEEQKTLEKNMVLAAASGSASKAYGDGSGAGLDSRVLEFMNSAQATAVYKELLALHPPDRCDGKESSATSLDRLGDEGRGSGCDVVGSSATKGIYRTLIWRTGRFVLFLSVHDPYGLVWSTNSYIPEYAFKMQSRLEKMQSPVKRP